MFAACEYYVVFSNIAFHGSMIIEFPNLKCILADVPSLEPSQATTKLVKNFF